jgi:hypothetical protein
VYSASRANGEAGVGWTVQGLSKISRCPRIHALDGYAAPIRNDETDAFCIDGKRLVEVEKTLDEGLAEYRTVIDSFARVIAYQGDGYQLPEVRTRGRVAREKQGPDYFKVWTKDGRILTFGREPDSLLLLHDGVRTGWLLNRVEDRIGNQMTIHYDNALAKVPPAGTLPIQVRPARIAYTGIGNVAGNREVRFRYGQRADQELRYMQGGLAKLIEERLEAITTFVKGEPVKNYRLRYAPDRPQTPSRVEGITECEGDREERCKPETRFTYVEQSGFEQGSFPVFIPAAIQLDANGDGVPDFMDTTVEINGKKAQPALQAAMTAADVTVLITTTFLLSSGVGTPVAIGCQIFKIALFMIFEERPKIKTTHSLTFGSADRSATPTTIPIVRGLPCSLRPFHVLDFDKDGKDDIVAECDGMIPALSMGDGHFQAQRYLPFQSRSSEPCRFATRPCCTMWTETPSKTC